MVEYFSLDRLLKVIPQLLSYVHITFQIVLVAVVFGSLLGILVAVLRINRVPVIYQLLSVYISFMRGTPMLVQMMVLYYGLPLLLEALFGININSWNKLVFVELTFVLNEGAFEGELFRGAIESVPRVQTEAGYSVGLNCFQTFTRIVLPQSVKTALPAYGVAIVGIFQNTSIAFMLGVIDMLGRANTIGAASGHAMEAYIVVALVYIIVSLILRFAFGKLDKKVSFGREERQHVL